jgi:hypothetical protein
VIVFNESFDDPAASQWTGSIDNGNGSWIFGQGGTTPTDFTGPNGPTEGFGYAFYESSGDNSANPAVITSREIDMLNVSTEAELSFELYTYGQDRTQIEVLMGTDPTGTFTSLFTFAGELQQDEDSNWVSVGVDVPSTFFGELVYVRIIATDVPGNEGDLAIDDMKIQSCGDLCFEPVDLTVDRITADTARFNWEDNAIQPAIGYEWVILPAGDPRPTGAGTPELNVSVDITGLTPVTSYDVYVRAECKPGVFSRYAGPLNFVTECAVYDVPYGEFRGVPGNNFEDDFPGNPTSPDRFPGECWEEGADTSLAAGPQGGNSLWRADDFGNNPASLNREAARINIVGDFTFQEWLVSPVIDLGAPGHGNFVSFEIALTPYEFGTPPAPATTLDPDDRVLLLISTDNGVTWNINNPLAVWDSSSTIAPDGQAVGIDLDGFDGEVRFAFWATNGGNDGGLDVNFYVDNFVVDAAFGNATPEQLGFSYYPNPVKNDLNFTSENNIISLTVMNMLGQEIMTLEPDDVNASLDLSTLAPSVYLVRVETFEGESVIKVVKE